MMKKQIQINKELTKIIQRIDLEQQANYNIIQFLNNHHLPQINKQQYIQACSKRKFEFEEFKNAIEEIYIKPTINGKIIIWHLNYDTSTIEVQYEKNI